jgi:hypothetical protein
MTKVFTTSYFTGYSRKRKRWLAGSENNIITGNKFADVNFVDLTE